MYVHYILNSNIMYVNKPSTTHHPITVNTMYTVFTCIHMCEYVYVNNYGRHVFITLTVWCTNVIIPSGTVNISRHMYICT